MCRTPHLLLWRLLTNSSKPSSELSHETVTQTDQLKIVSMTKSSQRLLLWRLLTIWQNTVTQTNWEKFSLIGRLSQIVFWWLYSLQLFVSKKCLALFTFFTGPHLSQSLLSGSCWLLTGDTVDYVLPALGEAACLALLFCEIRLTHSLHGASAATAILPFPKLIWNNCLCNQLVTILILENWQTST